MTLKVIQLNLFKGKFLDSAIEFLKRENPDFITMQEVTAGAVNFYEKKDADLFEILKKELGMTGIFHSDIKLSDEPSVKFGNAVFSKWPILESKVVPLNYLGPITLSEFKDTNVWARFSRHMLDATVDVEGFRLHVISVHGRRVAPPADDDENVRQARLMAKYIKSLGEKPFIIGGDFNMPPDSEVIRIVSAVARNLMVGKPISQTLNPRVHELGEKGYLVDYIFTSHHFRPTDVSIPDIDVSDHLPVVVLLEFDHKGP